MEGRNWVEGGMRLPDHVSPAYEFSTAPADIRTIRTKIDVAKRKYELLTPSPGRLPSRVAIVGSVEWVEDM